MKSPFHSRLAPGLPRDWHERPTVGAARGRRIGAPGWFLLGLILGMMLGLLTVGALRP